MKKLPAFLAALFVAALAMKVRPVLCYGDAMCLFLAVYFALTGWREFLREVAAKFWKISPRELLTNKKLQQ